MGLPLILSFVVVFTHASTRLAPESDDERPPVRKGPNRYLQYLVRYVHRVAFANSRLIRIADGEVSHQTRWFDGNLEIRVGFQKFFAVPA